MRVAALHAKAMQPSLIVSKATKMHTCKFLSGKLFAEEAHLARHRSLQASLDNVLELVLVVCNTATGTAEGECRANDDGEATNEVGSNEAGLFQSFSGCRDGHLQTDLLHRLKHSVPNLAENIAYVTPDIIYFCYQKIYIHHVIFFQ